MTRTRTDPPSVAVIGCGPSGMFFLHALAHRRARLVEQRDEKGIAALPIVTCFERSSGPGGVWRSNQPGGNSCDGEGKQTSMYGDLWTNAAKEAMEFFDYTYLEHFGRQLPMFLPRKLALDYIMKRCTRGNPKFFDLVKFNSSVESVKFDATSSVFSVKVLDINSKRTSEGAFDFVIWAGGNNGKRNIPFDIDRMLKSKGFKGKIMHSSQTDSSFYQDVRGNNIVIIGDQHSAEDLALYAIKLGAKSVEIASRNAEGVAAETGSWPGGKVRVNEHYIPTGVTSDGHGVVLTNVRPLGRTSEEVPSNNITIHSVDMVIYCTGYEHNWSMLEESLRPKINHLIPGQDVHKDWKMLENPLSQDLGDVPLGKISPKFAFLDQNFYRGRLRSNPSMFFMLESVHEEHIIALDVTAWLFLAQITGDLALPLAREIERFNRDTLLSAMDSPLLRYQADRAYSIRWKEIICMGHWAEDRFDGRTRNMIRNLWELQYRILARDALDSGYPLGIGSFDDLNERGRALVSFNLVTDYARYNLGEGSAESGQTFRDCDSSDCYSIFTGQIAAPLKRRWLELDGSELDDIVDVKARDGNSLGHISKATRTAMVKLDEQHSFTAEIKV